MLEVYLRPIYQSVLVDPIARMLSNYSPMTITYVACLSGIMVAPALMFHHPSLAIALLLFSGFLDSLDGTVARANNKVSEQGIIFDIVSDRVVEAAVILGLFAIDPANRGWLAMAMLASSYICVTSFLVVGVFKRAKDDFQLSTGIMERAEAFLFFLLMIALPNHFNMLAWLFIGFAMYTSYLQLARFLQTTTDAQQ